MTQPHRSKPFSAEFYGRRQSYSTTANMWHFATPASGPVTNVGDFIRSPPACEQIAHSVARKERGNAPAGHLLPVIADWPHSKALA